MFEETITPTKIITSLVYIEIKVIKTSRKINPIARKLGPLMTNVVCLHGSHGYRSQDNQSDMQVHSIFQSIVNYATSR